MARFLIAVGICAGALAVQWLVRAVMRGGSMDEITDESYREADNG